MDLPREEGARRLRYAAALFVVAILVHTADHLRRGTQVLTDEVLWLGYISYAADVVVVVMILVRHRLAPLFAVVYGFGKAIGVSAVHLLPRWSDFSDPFPAGTAIGVTPLSWVVAMFEVVASILLGIAGLRALRVLDVQVVER